MLFQNPINLAKNELQNAVIQVLGTAPGSPVIGLTYFDSVTSAITWRNAANNAWVNPLDRSFHTGTQLASTISDFSTAADARIAAASGVSIQPLDGDLTAIAALAGTAGLARKTAANTWSLDTSTYLTSNESISVSGDASGSGTTAITLTLATVNGSPQADQFRKITVNGKGLVTATSAVVAADIPTLTAAKISDFDTQVRTSRLDQMATPIASVSMNSQKIINLLAPTSDTDAANKKYVDDSRAGLSVKNPVRVVAQANVTIASPGATIDGVSMAANDRFLAPSQSTGTENGIYVWNGAATPATRAADADEVGEVQDGSLVAVSEGTNAGSQYIQTATPSGAPGSWTMTWTLYSTGGTAYTAGAGLTLTSTTFDVGAGTGITVNANDVALDTASTRNTDHASVSITAGAGLTGGGDLTATRTITVGAGTGITVNADDVAVDTAVVVRKVTALIGNGSLTSIPVAHNLGNQWIHAHVVEVATSRVISCEIEMTDANTATFIFSPAAPTTNQFRVIIQG